MAKKNPYQGLNQPLIDCLRHYNDWTEDGDKRRTRPNGWDAVTDAYWGKLPTDWPYNSRVIDPRIRTSVIEKDARLINNKLRGRLVPREGGDVLKARINNALLDFQWDNANEGGTMLSKWHGMSQDTRMYASCFGLVKWRYELNEKGEVVFNGNDFQKLDDRNVGMDFNCDGIRNASWAQVRGWEKIEDLELQNDTTSDKPMYPGLAELKGKISINYNDRRDTAYPNRALQLKGLTDRVGQDRSFPVCEVVTEYRKDRWITFAPKYKVILRDIPNPYKHGKIPVVQLRYYKLTGDPWGESEVEPVLPIWKAIQANLCGYMDNLNIHNRPPLKILDGQVRIETIVFGPEAQMIMNRPDAVTEFQGSTAPIQYFQTTHSALIAAFNTAMGDLSQGNSGVDPFNPQKTATEIKQSVSQQNSRDQMNQNSLAEAIEDMMSMWLVNNQQFLFADDRAQEYILRIVGSDLYNYFQRAGMDEMEVTNEAMQAIGDVVHQQGGNVSDDDMQALIDAGQTPKFPVFSNPNEKDPAKLEYKPKMRVNEMGDGAEVSIMPDDLEGNYDYVADVKSMASGADSDLQQARQKAIADLTGNPVVLQLLQLEGIKPQIKELLVSELEDLGLKDAERFFGKIDNGQNQIASQPQQGNGTQSPQQVGGLPAGAPASTQGIIPGQAPQPQGLPQQGGF